VKALEEREKMLVAKGMSGWNWRGKGEILTFDIISISYSK